jgi:hypothetical protein
MGYHGDIRGYEVGSGDAAGGDFGRIQGMWRDTSGKLLHEEISRRTSV